MITASMVLVAVAAVLLVAGVLDGGLALVWASIVVCLVAGGLLFAGVQRARPPSGPLLGDGREGESQRDDPASSWPAEYEGPGYPPPPEERGAAATDPPAARPGGVEGARGRNAEDPPPRDGRRSG